MFIKTNETLSRQNLWFFPILFLMIFLVYSSFYTNSLQVLRTTMSKERHFVHMQRSSNSRSAPGNHSVEMKVSEECSA